MPSLMPKEITDLADTWFSARMVQACAKQACGIVRGCRLFIISPFLNDTIYSVCVCV